MAARLSTGLVNRIMGKDSFIKTFDLGFIDIYSGTQPATADDVPNGVRLITLYSDGKAKGLSWDPVVTAGAVSKLSSESWTGTVAIDGVAGWFRLREAADPGTASSASAARYDGAIATYGSQMNLGSLSLLKGAPFLVAAASFTLPQA